MPKLTEGLLTTLTVANGRKDRLVFDTVAPGLGVRVTAKGTRTFIAQWTDPATKRKVRECAGRLGRACAWRSSQYQASRVRAAKHQAPQSRRIAHAALVAAILFFQRLVCAMARKRSVP
jgi:hypothetical protein